MKKNRNIQKISTFNCKGLLSSTKQRLLAIDFEKYKTAAMCIQETHMKRYGVIISNQVMETTAYYNQGHKTKSINGVGIVVAANRNINFEPISDRICVITTKINNTHKLIIISVYAPTLETSEKNHDARDNFYNELGSIISRVKS